MPVTYALDVSRGLVKTTCRGVVRLPDVIAHFDALEADPACPEALNVMLDLRGLETPPSTPELEGVAQRIGGLSRLAFGRCAIVVDREVLFGIARMFEAHAGSRFTAISIFGTPAEAEAWLTA